MSTRDDIREVTSEQSATSFMTRLAKAIWRMTARRQVQQGRESRRMALDTQDERDALLDEWEEDHNR